MTIAFYARAPRFLEELATARLDGRYPETHAAHEGAVAQP